MIAYLALLSFAQRLMRPVNVANPASQRGGKIMDTNLLMWTIVGVVVLIIVLAVAYYSSRRRREAKIEADRGRADEIRAQAQEDGLAARAHEADALRAEADAELARIDAERMERDAAARQSDAADLRAESEAQLRHADDIDPDTESARSVEPEPLSRRPDIPL